MTTLIKIFFLTFFVFLLLFQLKLYPTQTEDLNLIGLDQFNNPTYFIARLLDSTDSTVNFMNVNATFILQNNFNFSELMKIVSICMYRIYHLYFFTIKNYLTQAKGQLFPQL